MNRDFPARHVINVIKPQLLNTTPLPGEWLPMTNAVRIFAIINIGGIDTTVGAKFQQATDAVGTGAKDVPGAALLPYTATDDDTFCSIDLEAACLDINNGFTYVQLVLTPGTGSTGANMSAVLIRESRHNPPTQPANYKQRIVVAG